MTPPKHIDAGRTILWSLPRSILHRCGMTSPTNPMTPQNATQTDVSTEARISIHLLNLLTSRPICRAWSSPRSTRFSSFAHIRGTSERNTDRNTTMPTCDQVTSAKDPYSQDRALLSLFPAIVSMMVWTAENASPTTTPDRT